jgi:hypothetical protein
MNKNKEDVLATLYRIERILRDRHYPGRKIQHVATTPKQVVNICEAPYNAIPDFQVISGTYTFNTGSHSLTGVPASTFSALDIGKAVIVLGCGNANATLDLFTSITAVAGDGSGCTFANTNQYNLPVPLAAITVSWGTDNTCAIQAAHDACFNVGGYTMYIPYGRYLFNSQLRIKETVCITGDSPGGTDIATDGGSVLVYGGQSVAMLFAPSTLGADSAPSMHAKYEHWQLSTCTQNSLIGVQLNDCYVTLFENVFVWGDMLLNGIDLIGGTGFRTCGIQCTSTTVNTAFSKWIGCQSTVGGDGVQIVSTSGTTFGFHWDGGALTGNGGWGLNSLAPEGGSAAPTVYVGKGTDLEGNGSGGVTGYFSVVTLDGCYYESASGAMIEITGSQYAYAVNLIDNYISRWGNRPSAFYLATAAGIQGVRIEGNISRWPGTGFLAARSMVTIAGCKRVRIGQNDSYLANTDFDDFNATYDPGCEMVPYRFVIPNMTKSMDTGTVSIDGTGQVFAVQLARIGGVVGIRCWMNSAPTDGTWNVVCEATGSAPFEVIGATAPPSPNPIVIETDAPFSWVSGMEVTIAGVLGNTAANGSWTIAEIDSTHFSLNGSTGSGTYTSGGSIAAVLRDTGALSFPTQNVEKFANSTGNSSFTVEEQTLPVGTQISVSVETSAGFAVASNTALVVEVTIGYLNVNASELEIP